MLNIVLIDDDPISTFLTEKLISSFIKAPCQFLKFESARTALEEIRDIDLNYLFLDLNMPEMDGWDFLDNFRPRNDHAKIYILSSSIDEQDMSKARQYHQVKEYLPKPLIRNHIKMIFG
jgi:CheY-like chemotaxis protein